MRPSVLVQVSLLTECFLTKVTLERSVTGVCSHVRLKIGFLRKLFATNLAAVSVSLFLRTVNSGMDLENLHRLETLLTHIALEILSLLVDKIVSLLQVFRWIEFAAVLALDKQVLVYEMLPPVTLHLGHIEAGVVTARPVTPNVTKSALKTSSLWEPRQTLPTSSIVAFSSIPNCSRSLSQDE